MKEKNEPDLHNNDETIEHIVTTSTEAITFAIEDKSHQMSPDPNPVNPSTNSCTKFSNILTLNHSGVFSNLPVDISYEARQIESGFQKIAEKCNLARAGKRQQKETKKGRKCDEDYSIQRNTKASRSKPTTVLLPQIE
jgi:hypothetical protein